MSSDDASLKKMSGHVRESDFAQLVGGSVYDGPPTDKTDVIDGQGGSHSIKGGQWWQIFLYSRSRFENNTGFIDLGNVASLMIRCIDSLPEDWEAYKMNKEPAKHRLQEPMRLLKAELVKPDIRPAFYEKAIFNGKEVDYWSLRPLYIHQDKETEFHIFAREDVVRVLSDELDIQNSRARGRGQTDAQKVIFRLNKNVGEIELRTDRLEKYRLAKMRLHGPSILDLLTHIIPGERQITDELIAHGNAIQTFRI